MFSTVGKITPIKKVSVPPNETLDKTTQGFSDDSIRDIGAICATYTPVLQSVLWRHHSNNAVKESNSMVAKIEEFVL